MKGSKIEWCDHTFNPWEGCTKVSPGCANCYAEARNKRWAGGVNWGPGAPRRRTSAANWRQPLQWDRDAEKTYLSAAHSTGAGERIKFVRPRVFCASLADVFDPEVPCAWRRDLFFLITQCHHLDFLLLTKRPELVIDQLKEISAGLDDGPNWDLWADWKLAGGLPNVWIGTTVEDQKRAEQRIPELLKIPARVRFLSCEPLLGPVNLKNVRYYECGPNWNEVDALRGHESQCSPGFRGMSMEGGGSKEPRLHWVICGGESGPKARPFVVEWADDLRRQCSAAGVPFFMKQLGANPRTSNANALDWPEETRFEEDDAGEGSAAGARVLLVDPAKGGDIKEFPEELRVRQFPEVRP